MKLQGKITRLQVVVLIDCGASHNFISMDLVQKLGIPSVSSHCFGVRMGTGLSIKGEGLCKEVTLQLQNFKVIADFLPLKLGSADMILGMQWLEKLGGMQVNWKNLTMQFRQGDSPVTLQGDPSLCNSLISLKAILKAIKGEREAILLELCSLISSKHHPQESSLPDPISLFLQEYVDVFDEPKSLPLVRDYDHAIVLQPGSGPINVRPYRYPHHQKFEIKKLVRDMLSVGIIQLSVSPFSSTVLLVKKKDDGWRFCVDYRSLNKILIVHELLDEFHGATIFSKLDLRSGYHHIHMR